MTSRVAGEVFEILDSHRVDITRVEGLYCVCGYKLSIREELAGHHAAMLEQRGLLRPEIDGAMIERGAKALWKHVHAEPGVKAHRWEELGEVAKGFARDEVRAVLEDALGGEQA